MNALTKAPAASLAQPILLALGRMDPAQLEAERQQRQQYDNDALRDALEGRLEDPERWDGMA